MTRRYTFNDMHLNLFVNLTYAHTIYFFLFTYLELLLIFPSFSTYLFFVTLQKRVPAIPASMR